MLLCTRRLSHTLLQSSLFKPPFRHYSFRASEVLVFGVPGLNVLHDTRASATVSESATTSSLPGSQETQFWSKMKALIEGELSGATYHVDLTTKDGILHADPRIVEVVNDRLRTTFETLTSRGSSSEANPRFPKKRFTREDQSYKPLIHLLNKIIDTANLCLPPSQPRSQLGGLRFHVFGGEVKETYGSHGGLKLGGVGIIGKLPTKTKKSAKMPAEEPGLSWGQIEVTIKSKSSVKEMVRQSATYPSCCLLADQRRFFGIGFDHKKLEAYVFVYHKSGLSSSRPLKVTTGEGFKGLVSHIVGILSFKEEAAYGLDTTRFQNIFRINDRYYEIVHPLYMRCTVRGRSTTIFRLQGMYTYGS